MEFHEKLQELRKQKHLTQEELANALYISRAAVSKWESGRGYPSIDSLKEISRFYSVSIDDLLSGEELLSLAETDQQEKTRSLRDLVFGILDCMTAILFFLPFFGQPNGNRVEIVPLLSFNEHVNYIWLSYAVIVSLTTMFGIIQLTLQNCQYHLWVKNKVRISFALTIISTMFAIMNRQPYPGGFWLCLLIIKGILLQKQP